QIPRKAPVSMKNGFHRRVRTLCPRPLLSGLVAALLIMAGMAPGVVQTVANAQTVSQTREYTATVAYLVRFYPLWFTYYQARLGATNTLIGPDHVSAVYQVVVAINYDTQYASTFVDLTDQPAILTIPSSTG